MAQSASGLRWRWLKAPLEGGGLRALRNENVVLEGAAVGAACAAAPPRQAGRRAPGTPRFRPKRAPGRGVQLVWARACGDQGLGVGHEAHGGDARRDAERRPSVGGRREAGVAEEPQLAVGVAACDQVPLLGERKPRRSASARVRGGAVPRRVAGRGRHRARVERVHVREGAEGRDLRPGDQTLAARARPASAGQAREAGARGGVGPT